MKLLYSKEKIAARVKALAVEVKREYADKKDFLCVGVLNGAFMFYADFVRHLGDNAICAFIRLSSYEDSTTSSGRVRLIWDFTEEIMGKDILVIDDICDSGHTLKYLRDYFLERGAKAVKVVCLLDKPKARINAEKPDFAAFELEGDEFIVGYGLDDKRRYRNLDGVYVNK